MSFERHAEDLGRDLAEHGVGAGSEVRGADQQVERSVVVDLDRARAHVDDGDPGALDGERHPEAPSNVRPIRRTVPGGILAPLPADRSQSLCRALLETATRDERQVLGSDLLDAAPLAEARHDVERIARLDPVAAAELCRIKVERSRDVVHVRLEGEERLRCAVATECAGHHVVRVRDVAAVALRRASCRGTGRAGR